MKCNKPPQHNRLRRLEEETARPVSSPTSAARIRPLVFPPAFRILASALVCLLLVGIAAASESGERRKAKKEVASGNFDNAERIYRKLIDKDPKDSDARLGLSLLFLKQRNLAAAYDEAAKVLKTEPTNSRAQALLATALLRSGFVPLSIEYLRMALQLNIKEHLALASAAEIDLYENRTQEAFQKLKLATFVQPEEPDYWLIYARAASRLQYFKDAADALRQFLRFAPKNDVARRDRIEGVIKFYSYLGNSEIYRLSGGKSATVALNIRGRRPYFDAKVNGKGALRFVIDTGSGVTVISYAAAERLGIREIARGGSAHAVGGEGTFPIVYGLIDEIDFNGIKVRTVPVYIRDIHSPESTPKENIADGYLGLSLLSNFVMTLDYKEKELKLVVPGSQEDVENLAARDASAKKAAGETAPADQVKSGPVVIPFRMTESGLISVEGKIDDEASVNLIFDSGASSTVIASSVVEKQNWDKKVLRNQFVRVIGAAGVTENVKLLHAVKLQIADLIRENLRMPILSFARLNEHAGFEQQGILGGDFLHQCRVHIDFRRLLLELTPHSSSAVKRIGDSNLSAKDSEKDSEKEKVEEQEPIIPIDR